MAYSANKPSHRASWGEIQAKRHKIKHCSSYLRKSENLMHVLLIMLLLKMGNIFQEYQRKRHALVQGWAGWLSQNHTHAYRVGGLVNTVMIISVRTFWGSNHLVALPSEGSQ